jgi:hypothetical protein
MPRAVVRPCLVALPQLRLKLAIERRLVLLLGCSVNPLGLVAPRGLDGGIAPIEVMRWTKDRAK